MAKRLALYSFLMLLALPLRAAAEPRQILLLHSFEREFAPFDAFVGNFRRELSKNSPEQVSFYEVSLQPVRSNEIPQEKPILDYMHAMFANRQLDLVVPIGGPAVRFAQKYRQNLFPETPMLLAAADQRHLNMAAVTPRDAIVGVVNDGPLIIDNILRLFPKTTRVCVVLGNSQLEKFWHDELEREFQRFKGRLTFDWFSDLSFKEILERSATLPSNSAIFYVLLSVDAKGVSQTESRGLSELHAVANAPIFGFHATQLGLGIVGGPLMSIDDLSRNAADVAVRILDGESPERLRPAPQLARPQIFDWRELRRWGISEDRLPPDSIVRFRELTVWARYKWEIVAALSVCLLQALLILALIANLNKRRRAERALGESTNRLGAILNTAAEGILAFNDRGIIESVNAAAQNLFGYAAEEMLGRNVSMVLDGQTISPDIRGTVREAIGRRKDGSMFPIDLAVGEVVLADRRLLTGFVRDITERKQVEQMQREFGKQLVQAQEAERARLARELHDDITQRLALLAMNADRLDSEADPTEQRKAMRGIRDGLMGLSEDVHSLAYKLHPALLERLGLAAALRAECERLSRQESISVDAKFDELPADIDQEARLCLFRVAQEALRNVARHARAQAVQVSLRSLDGGLLLAVVDNGAGFDSGEEPQQPSLGLASMRERVRLLEGKLYIESHRGLGTTVLAWIPVKAHNLPDAADREKGEAAKSARAGS